MKKLVKNHLLILCFAVSILTQTTCNDTGEDFHYLGQQKYFWPISQDGNYGITGNVYKRHGELFFARAVVRILDFNNGDFNVIDSLPLNIDPPTFCEYPYLTYSTFDSIGYYVMVHNYKSPESTYALLSNKRADTSNSWILYVGGNSQLSVIDSLVYYRTKDGLTLKKIRADGSVDEIRHFKDGNSPRFSNDGKELLMFLTVNLESDSAEYHIVSYDIQKDSTTKLFQLDFIEWDPPPSSVKLGAPVYYRWREPGTAVSNVWKYSRTDSTFEQVTFYAAPHSVEYFQLTNDSMICLVSNQKLWRASHHHFYEIVSIK